MAGPSLARDDGSDNDAVRITDQGSASVDSIRGFVCVGVKQTYLETMSQRSAFVFDMRVRSSARCEAIFPLRLCREGAAARAEEQGREREKDDEESEAAAGGRRGSREREKD